MDLNSLTDEQVYARIQRVMDGFTTIRPTLQTNMMFRARRNEVGQAFENARELWYPPADIVPRGRFNNAGEPVFYLTNRMVAAFWEIQPKVGDLLTVLAVGRKPPMREIVCATIGMERCKAPEVVENTKGRWVRDRLMYEPERGQRQFRAKFLALDDYLADLATGVCPNGQEHIFYKPTLALKRMLMSIPGVDALHYPSVATNLNAANLCLSTDKADELFKPDKAWMVRIEDHREDLPGATASAQGYLVKFLMMSGPIAADGTLAWQPVPTGGTPVGLMAPPLPFDPRALR